MFFIMSPTKLGRVGYNLVHSFLNKFATESCKRFPPHLNNVSTTVKLEILTELSEKVTPKFIPHQLWPPHSPAGSVDYSV